MFKIRQVEKSSTVMSLENTHPSGRIRGGIFRTGTSKKFQWPIIYRKKRPLLPLGHNKRNRRMLRTATVVFTIGVTCLLLLVACQPQASTQKAVESSAQAGQTADPATYTPDWQPSTIPVEELVINEDVQRSVMFQFNTLAYMIPGWDEVHTDNITYAHRAETPLTMDVYYPPGMEEADRLPVVLFVIGYRMSALPLRDAHFYTSWGKTAAAAGMVGIVYDTEQPDQDLELVMNFITEHSDALRIDPDRIGIFASSANVATAMSYVMQEGREHISFAVYYYGLSLTPDRKYTEALHANCARRGCLLGELADVTYVDPELPLFVVKAGRDSIASLNEGLDYFVDYVEKAGAPITFIEYEDGRHGFDTEQETEEAADIVEQTVTFMQENLAVGTETLPPPLVLRNGLLVTATGENPISDGTIVVEDGLITYVGTADGLALPDGATVIDVQGRTILPGLIDARASDLLNRLELNDGQLTDVALALYLTSALEAGITTVRGTGWEWEKMQNIELLRAALAKQGNSIPTVVIAGSSLAHSDGQGADNYAHQVVGVATVDEARQVTERLIELGADQINLLQSVSKPPAVEDRDNLPPRLTPEQLVAIVEVAHSQGKWVAGQALFPGEATELIAAGVDEIINWPAAADPMPDAFIKSLVDGHIPVVSGFFISPPQEGDVRRFLDAGGTIVYGTFAPNSHPISTTSMEFGVMLVNGMTPLEIIMAATAHAAQVVGLGDELGTLEAGKVADIIVVDGDPLQDFSVMSDIIYVIKGGELVVTEGEFTAGE